MTENEDKTAAGHLNDGAAKAFKAAGYTALALKGDVGGLAKKAALDVMQNEELLKKAEQGLEKVTDIPAVPRSLTQNFAKVSKGALGAVPFLSIPIKLLSAKEIADKVGGEFRKGEYVRGGTALCSELSQTFLGTAAGSVVSEGIRFAAGQVDPRYAPEKSGGRQTVESLIDGCQQLSDTVRGHISGSAPKPI